MMVQANDILKILGVGVLISEEIDFKMKKKNTTQRWTFQKERIHLEGINTY